jgi:hypothetical protein
MSLTRAWSQVTTSGDSRNGRLMTSHSLSPYDAFFPCRYPISMCDAGRGRCQHPSSSPSLVPQHYHGIQDVSAQLAPGHGSSSASASKARQTSGLGEVADDQLAVQFLFSTAIQACLSGWC